MTAIVALTGADEHHVSLTFIEVLDGDEVICSWIVAQVVYWLNIARCAVMHSGRAEEATV